MQSAEDPRGEISPQQRELRIPALLSTEALGYYDALLTPEQQIRVEEMLEGVERLGDRRYDELKARGHEPETNLDHEGQMLGILNHLVEAYPALGEEINVRDASMLIIIHDLAEDIVGDVPSAGPERDTDKAQQAKRIEPYVVERMIRHIEDPGLRQEVRQMYEHYIHVDTNPTKVGLLVKVLDKIQGDMGASRLGDWDIRGFDGPLEWQHEHVAKSLSKMTMYAVALLAMLETEQAREAIYTLAKVDIEEWDRIGFHEEAMEALGFLDLMDRALSRVIFSRKNIETPPLSAN